MITSGKLSARVSRKFHTSEELPRGQTCIFGGEPNCGESLHDN